MSFDITLKKFRLISGLTEEELAQWVPVIRESLDYVKSLLVCGALNESDKIRVASAAAVYAYYRYISYSVREESAFSAGDMSVTFNSEKRAQAREMWLDELSGIADIADASAASGFVLRAVV